MSGFVRDANGSVSVKSTQYSLDATTAGGMSLLFGGDANGALDYTKGISAPLPSDWTMSTSMTPRLAPSMAL